MTIFSRSRPPWQSTTTHYRISPNLLSHTIKSILNIYKSSSPKLFSFITIHAMKYVCNFYTFCLSFIFKRPFFPELLSRYISEIVFTKINEPSAKVQKQSNSNFIPKFLYNKRKYPSPNNTNDENWRFTKRDQNYYSSFVCRHQKEETLKVSLKIHFWVIW